MGPSAKGELRYAVKLDHGFRKFFNTMMRRTTGLENHYERYNEEDFERFPEYEKAIPFLTIFDTERVRLESAARTEKINHIRDKHDAEI